LPNEDSLRVLIAGGGTGGHVIPALAIARELRDTAQSEVRFVGTARGIETKLVPEAGFALELIHVGMLKNVSLMTRARTLTDLPRGILRCMSLLRSFRPHVVVGVGGYASGPAMMAAVLLRFPTLAFEPNAVPGLANRLVGKWVSAAAVNFEETRQYFHGARVTGIPVRHAFFELPPKSGAAKRLLVFGGSQGARALNETMPKIAGRLLEANPNLEIVHQAGGRHGTSTADAYERSGLTGEHVDQRVRVQPYLDDMPGEFAEADLILCRSGASTMAELGAAGKPSLLIPFPQASDDHQKKNAQVFARAGAAEMLLEEQMTPERLLDCLIALLGDKDRLAQMSVQASHLSRPDALHSIAQMALELAGRTS
jgi:UDP-N-acetylglucosamine--N-acetylmuramyl-(pentapeptide) pyrophosphoryl-undecaprenol N-acetylglucosamine transferase